MQCIHSFERYEKKYILTRAQYEAILPEIEQYMVMDVYGKYTICNIYYDTQNYDLIRQSLKKPYYKEKFRVRSYGVPESDAHIFAEIKKKSADIVYKRRVDATPGEIDAFLCEGRPLPDNKQIQNEIRWFMSQNRPSPKVFIGYDRTAYAGIEDPEFRLTFDRNIRYRLHDLDLRSGDYGEPLTDDDTIIMEVKVKDAMPLWLVPILSENRIYPGSFSKYGACYERFIAREAFSPAAMQQVVKAPMVTEKQLNTKAAPVQLVYNHQKGNKSCSRVLLEVLSPLQLFLSAPSSRWHSAS